MRNVRFSLGLIIILIIGGFKSYSQISNMMDYETPIVNDGIKEVTIYDFGKVSPEEWELIGESNDIDSRDTTEKTIYVYNCDTLESVTNYYTDKDEWVKNSKVALVFKGDNVIESTTAYVMGDQFTLDENYKVDYFWITKLSKYNFKQIKKLGSSKSKILNGNRIVTEGTNDTTAIVNYYDSNDLQVRDEKYITKDGVTEVIVDQLGLSKPFTLKYDAKGNLIEKFGSNISYIYDDNGNWILAKRNSNLLKREVVKCK